MVDRTVLVRLRADVSDFVAKSSLAKAAVRDLHNEIDKSNDRTAWLAQGILALVPAVTRLGAGAVPVLSGIATQLTVGIGAAATAALAFNGIGDALDALNEYQLDPTEANLAKLNETMSKVGADGQAFVEFLDSLGPALSQLSNSARAGVFPGMIDGISDFMELAPQLNVIVREIGEGIGQLAAEAGAGLSSERAAPFFEYLETRAKPILVDMGRTIGNFTLGFMNMLVEFDPLTEDFSKGLLNMSRTFAEWSEGLSTSNGFQEFLDYVREAGPDALDFMQALIMALVDLATAAAPVGELILPVLTGMLNVLGDLATTPLGPIALGFLSLTAAWGRLNAVMAITGSGVLAKATSGIRASANEARAAVPTFRQLGNAMAFSMTSTDALVRSSFSYSQAANRSALNALKSREAVKSFGTAVAPVAGQVGLLALAMSDVDDKMGLTNTTALALAGSMAGPYGAALGAAAGFALDLSAASDEATAGLDRLDESIRSQNIDQLASTLQKMKDELADFQSQDGFKDWFSDVAGDLFTGGPGESIDDIYGEKIKVAEAELRKLKATRDEVAADKSMYNSLQAETAALEANIAAMREKRVEALRGLNAELDYKASILDARDALAENGATVNENTRAGQANLRALYGLAEAWNQQDDATKNAAGSLRAARTNFIDMATAMGMGEDKARRLAKQLFEIPSERKVAIQIDADVAFQRLRSFKASIDSIDRNIVVGVSVQRGDTSGVPFLSGGVRRATGGTVPGQRTPYGDKIHTMLAPGEEVIANDRGQADMNRAALKAANAGAKLTVIGYATGGTVGGTPEERLAVLQAEQRVRELERALAKEGKDRLRGREREITQAELVVARRQLKEAQAAVGQAARDAQGTRDTMAAEDSRAEAQARAQSEADVRDEQDRRALAVIEGQEKAAQQLIDAAEAQKKSAEQVLEGWEQAMSRTGAAATADFRSSGFGQRRSGLWVGGSGGGAGWRDAYNNDIAGLEARDGLIGTLESLGLTGSALENLLGEASNDEIARMIANGEIGDYAATFSRRESLLGRVSTRAGQAAYGREYAMAAAQVSALGVQILALQQQLAAITAQRPVNVYEAISAEATAAEVARLSALSGAW